jgi:CHASE3 domain sensor protein
LEQLVSTLNDAETGQRGYVITGRDDYLQPHHEALIRYGEVIERIGTLTADNPQQQADLPRLRKLVSEKLNEVQSVIAARKDQGFEAAQEAMNADTGKWAIDEIRALVKTMQDHEQALLVERQASDNAAYRSAQFAIAASLAIGLVSLGAFIWLLQKHMKSVTSFTAQLFEQRELLRATLISIGDGVIARI